MATTDAPSPPGAGPPLPLLLLLSLAAGAAAGGGAPELAAAPDLYAEIRDLLSQRLTLQEEFPWAPRPRELPGWQPPLPGLGELSGVAVRPDGHPVLFHRGPRVWDSGSFNSSEQFQQEAEGAIAADTVLTLDRDTGQLIDSWGADLFYLPHGITVDSAGNTWLTDVALHQVFKFAPGGRRPELVLGERFRPGAGPHRFCKPTHVAVARTGRVFVADGYCNSRVLEFNGRGRLLRELPMPAGSPPLRVPHALALLEPADVLCIADRENRRVLCPPAGLRSDAPPATALTVHPPDLGRVFGIAARGEAVYAVNGPTSRHVPVRGFTLDPQAEEVLDRWGPVPGFNNPHAAAMCPSGRALYVAELEPPRVRKFELRGPRAPARHA